MLRVGILLVTTMACGPGLVFAQEARAGKLGVIGDSLSLATDADDQCSDAFECLENLGEDIQHSFSQGIQPGSLGVRLGATGTVRCIALVCGSGVSREGLRSDPFCEGPAKVSRWSAPSRLASLPQGRAGAPAEDLPMRH